MPKLLSIQYLRAIAALLVVGVHLHPPLEQLGYSGWFPDVMGAGVDVFFVISGVVMWLSTGSRSVGAGDFLVRRFVRVVPMYWLVTLLIAGVMVVMPWAVNNGRFDGEHLLASLLLVPWPHPTLTGHLYPVFVPGWTINIEMFFYVAFAVALFIPVRSRLLAVAGMFALLVAAGLVIHQTGTAVWFYTQPLILEFVLGLVIGRLYEAKVGIRPWTTRLLLAGGLGGLLLAQLFATELLSSDRLLVWGVPAALLVAGLIFAERAGRLPHWPVLGFLGDASYSVYLMHTIPLSAVSFVIGRLHLPPLLAEVTYVPAALLAVVLTGAATHHFVERPMTAALLSRLTVKKQRDDVGKAAVSA